MAALSKAEASLIRNLMEHQGWELVQRLYLERVQKLSADFISGSNAFETLRELHKNQGGAEALAQFFDDLDKGAFD